MGRKNDRRDAHVPLDEVAPDLVTAPASPLPVRTRWETRAEWDARLTAEAARKRERTNRRNDARVKAALDWDECCIPGCTEKLHIYSRDRDHAMWSRTRDHLRDVSQELPICARHQAIVVNQASPHLMDADVAEIRKSLARQRVEIEDKRAAHWDVLHENNGAKQGQIYFVRLNGMIKVGWSIKLRSRLKAYGASAEVLAHYPATRAEETDLHRSLRPFLAKGREWYQDCKLLEDVVAGVIERHGEPCIFPRWTEPKADVVATKRHAS